MEELLKNPNVLGVLESRMSLKVELRQQVYEEWVLKPEKSTVRRMLEINGFDTQRLGENFTQAVASVFKRGGSPKYSKASPETQANWSKAVYMPIKTVDELLESGRFVWDINRLILHTDFEAELYRNYPKQSIEDGLLSCGIAPTDVGYHKIYWLKENFESSWGRDTRRSLKKGRNSGYDAATVKQYANHQYIETTTREKVMLHTAFFENVAPLAYLKINDVLSVFSIEPSIFSATERFRISRVKPMGKDGWRGCIRDCPDTIFIDYLSEAPCRRWVYSVCFRQRQLAG